MSVDQLEGHQQGQIDPVVQEDSSAPQEIATSDDPPTVTMTQEPTNQTVPAIRQTCSGRVIRNTPCYDHSVDQRNQGLVAWEV